MSILGHTTKGIGVFLDILRRVGLEYYGKYYSCYPAVVVANDDPDNLARIKFNCPMLDLDNGDDHPRFAVPKFGPIPAGPNYGSHWVPDVGEQVWVEFRNGNPNDPMYTPMGYWQKGQLPKDVFESVKDRGFVTKSGHAVRYRDKEGEESVLIRHKGGTKMELDSKDRFIIESNGGDKITVDPNGDLTIEHRGGTKTEYKAAEVIISTPGGTNVKLDATNFAASATAGASLEAALVELKGRQVKLGNGANSPVVKGDVLLRFLQRQYIWGLTHTHLSTAPGTPTATALPPPPTPPPSLLSLISQTA